MILFYSLNGQDTCILYGPFYLNMQQPHSYFNFTFVSATDTITLKNFLNQAKQNNYYVALNLTGSRQNFQGPNNEFDLNKFKQLLNKFANFDFSPYYNRIICHLLFDEPHDPSNWGGTTVAFSTIDSAAAYSKLLFPALKTGVGAPATWLSQYGTYQYLDYCKPQYSVNKGNIQQFIQSNDSAAIATNLKLIYSINVLSGWYQQQSIPPQNLFELSIDILSDSLCKGLLYWKYDSSYFEDPQTKGKCAAIKDSLCKTTYLNEYQLNSPDVWPNPFTEKICLESAINFLPANVSIYDLAGKCVFETKIYNPTECLSLDFLPHGIYILKFKNEFGSRLKKIVKN